jgi:hypothetical protein
MRPPTYDSQDIIDLLRVQKIASMEDLKKALGTSADATVFRKLAEVPHRTSYSHRGRYYTLEDIPDFDEWGLWSFRHVWFSRRGTLMDTTEALVGESEAGLYSQEIESILHVEVRGCLLKLLHQERVAREKLLRRYLYCSTEAAKRKLQLTARRLWMSEPSQSGSFISTEIMPDELKAAIILFFSLLDERQRRLYAGLESLKMGHGGDREIADLFGLDVGTVARGRRQLVERDVELERIRREGGGRKRQEKKPRRSSSGSKR